MDKDYYVILGVSTEATPEEIRSAYRKRAQELHPDHYGPDTEPFLVIQEAYQALLDAQRSAREQVREERSHARARPTKAEALRARTMAEPMRTPSRHRPAISLTESFESYRPSFEEIFERFWGNFGDIARPKAEELRSLTVEIPLSPEEALHGGRVQITIPARAQCLRCHGHGWIGPYECWQCEGHGSLTADYPLEIAYPPGISNEYALQVPLQSFGINNFYLVVRFRVTASAI